MSATGKKGVKRTLDRKTIDFKFNALQEVEKGIKSKTEIAKDLNISHSTLSTWIKNADSIKEGYQNYGPKRKMMKTGRWDELEAALLKWFTNARDSGAVVTGPILMQKAKEYASQLEITDFEAKPGWLQRFKERHGISFKSICGESKSVETDSEAMSDWTDKLKNLLQSYSPDEIYNADETGIFYKMLPDKTYEFKNVDCHGGKRSKGRLTVLVCANMSGSDKMPLLVIGKSKKPRCFKNVKTLPLPYTANKKAWMTSEVFKDWCENLDKKMKKKKRKIVLVVDNCPAHPKQSLSNVELVFLPPNTTSKTQPMDQGVINNLKVQYRKRVVLQQIKAIDGKKEFSISLIDALYFLQQSWQCVSPATIANCFRHAGFVNAPEIVEADDESDELDDIPLSHLIRMGNPQSLSEFVSFNETIRTSEDLTDEDIISSVLEARNTLEIEDEDDGEEEEVANEEEDVPSCDQTMEFLNGVRSYFQAKEGTEQQLAAISGMIREVTRDKFVEISGRKQRTVLDYFRPDKVNPDRDLD